MKSHKQSIIFLQILGLAVYVMTVIAFLIAIWTAVVSTPEELDRMSAQIASMSDIHKLRALAENSVELNFLIRESAEDFSKKTFFLASFFVLIFICQLILWSKEWRTDKTKEMRPTVPDTYET